MKRALSVFLSVFALILFCTSAYADNKPTESFKVAGGTYEVGDDINAGKYSISVVDGYGYLTVYDSYDEYLKADGDAMSARTYYLLDADGTFGTKNVGILDLRDGMFVANQNASTIFTPVTGPVAEPGIKQEFTVYPGVYLVGEDFPEGKFSAEVQSGFGYFTVYRSYENYLEANGDVISSLETHLLDHEGSFGAVEIGNLRLKDGMYISNQGATLNVKPR